MKVNGRDVTCIELVELATDWMEGALSDSRRGAVNRHLATCADCVEYLAQLFTSVAILSRVVPDPPAPDARDELLAAFRARRAG